MASVVLGLVLVVGSVVACGGGDIGESCDEEGKVKGECDDDAVCGREKSQSEGSLVCLKQCTQPGDCGSGEQCAAVNGTNLRGCRKL